MSNFVCSGFGCFQARGQRAEYLRQRGGCRGSCHNHGQKLKHGDHLCRKLTRSALSLCSIACLVDEVPLLNTSYTGAT